jgi:hypothetical protein
MTEVTYRLAEPHIARALRHLLPEVGRFDAIEVGPDLARVVFYTDPPPVEADLLAAWDQIKDVEPEPEPDPVEELRARVEALEDAERSRT